MHQMAESEHEARLSPSVQLLMSSSPFRIIAGLWPPFSHWFLAFWRDSTSLGQLEGYRCENIAPQNGAHHIFHFFGK